MIRINLSMDNGATSKYPTARGGVCIPSPGNAGPTCPLQLVPWTQMSFAPSIQPDPAALVFGELSPSPTTPRPHHCCHRRRDPAGAPVPQTSQSHLPGGIERLVSQDFSGWNSTDCADSTILRYRDVPSPGRGSARHGGDKSPLLPKVGCPKGMSLSQWGT